MTRRFGCNYPGVISESSTIEVPEYCYTIRTHNALTDDNTESAAATLPHLKNFQLGQPRHFFISPTPPLPPSRSYPSTV